MSVDSQEKVVYTDLKGKHDLSMEINFSPEKDHVKVSIAGTDSIVKISDLFNFVFFIANAEEQEQMMPVKSETVRKIRKIHMVKATKDVKKGDMFKFRCETNVVESVWEGLKGMMGKEIKKSASNIPIIQVKK